MARNNGALICEFIGLPGAGKTTVRTSVQKALSDQGLRLADWADLFHWYKNLGLFRRLRLSCRFGPQLAGDLVLFLNLALSLRPLTLYRLKSALRWSLWDCRLRSFLEVRAPDVCLLDQWLLQEIWSLELFGTGASDKAKLRLLRHLLRRDPDHCYVLFDISTAEAAHRLAVRVPPRGRLDNQEEDWVCQQLIKHQGQLDQTMLEVRDQTDRFLEIDGRQEAAKSAGIIADWLLGYFHRRPPDRTRQSRLHRSVMSERT